MNKRERDRMSSLFWMLLALGICFGSVRLSLGDLHKPGPGFFSFLAGAILSILSFFVFLQSFKDKGPSEKEKEVFFSNPRRTLKMVYVIIALILYVIGMNYLGFFFSTLLFMGFLLRGIDPQRWSIVFLVSILGAITSYAVFQYWFDVPLPGGIFGF
ncbi:MAG: tripartite tricarboxylate transporter TctB family protein [Thermodesulfobacteriota bacterium]